MLDCETRSAIARQTYYHSLTGACASLFAKAEDTKAKAAWVAKVKALAGRERRLAQLLDSQRYPLVLLHPTSDRETMIPRNPFSSDVI